MNIKINTNISDEYKDIQININAPSLNKQTQMIIEAISNITTDDNLITGELDNNIYILHIEDVFCFASDEKFNYALTKKGNFRVRNTLYSLEQSLDSKNWVRISNSCIVNLNHIKCFDMGTIGSVVVVLEDGTKKYVSKRRIKEITNLLKNRRG